jgi:hypothetical protein
MSLASTFTKIKAQAYATYGKDPAKMLLHTGAFGWILSSIAQVAGVIVNDKIPTEQKKFLIPQEVADAAINVLSFYTITSGATMLAEKLVKTGKLVTGPVAKFVAKNMETAETKVKLGDFATNIEDLFSKDDADIEKAYYGFKTGVKVIASTLGAVVSSNLLTPYLRNIFGANAQKRSLKIVDVTKMPVTANNSRFGIEDYKKQAVMKSGYSFSSSSIKI